MSEVASLHTPFAAWLRGKGIEFVRARSDARSTIEKGWPDFTVLFPSQPAVCIEFKAGRGKESPDQVRVRERLEARGHRCHVCRSVYSAVAAVLSHIDGGETAGSSTMTALPGSSPRPTIRHRAGMGDWIFDGWQWVRPAKLDDHHFYSRQ